MFKELKQLKKDMYNDLRSENTHKTKWYHRVAIREHYYIGTDDRKPYYKIYRRFIWSPFWHETYFSGEYDLDILIEIYDKCNKERKIKRKVRTLRDKELNIERL